MSDKRFLLRQLVLLSFAVSLLVLSALPACAYESTTLRNGSRGDEVRELQQALIDLGYLGGYADGIFGNKTENAVRVFQRKNNLEADGLAGIKTRELIARQVSGKTIPAPEPTSKTLITPEPSSEPSPSSGSLFGGNYATIRYGDRGARVTVLQQSLINSGFPGGKADGIFGVQTLNAVKTFQRAKNLTADGLAGKKTLTALEKACSGNNKTPLPDKTPEPETESSPEDDSLNEKISPPKISKLSLLHWFNDIKPVLSNKQTLLIYDPASGLSWTHQILACGRHCDAEPLTAKDTRTMLKAFGGKNTWNQKAVFIRLPDGRWTIGSTHDMPHQSGNIRDNDFNGHLCVHFLRDMDETEKNDPNYGVSNQKTIRTYWKIWTGEDVQD